MMTLPRNRESIEEVYLLQWMYKHDIHKWIIAKEIGNDGYKHWQIRMQTRHTFEELKKEFPKAHIEEASNDYEYEKKEGNYYTSDDNEYTIQARYGELRQNQRKYLENLNTQNDRQIDVIIDTGRNSGNHGKTWLARHLFQSGKGFYVPPTIGSGKGIIQFIASGYRAEPIIIVDIARSTRWNTELYVALETIKDGLVYDTRYHHTQRDIHGVKVLVTCNEKPVLKRLSKDRWRLYDWKGEPYKDKPTLSQERLTT